MSGAPDLELTAATMLQPDSPSATIIPPHELIQLPELLLDIIDLLSSEPASLHACSLVSRSWQNSAQRNLLSRVWIYSDVCRRSPTAFIAFSNSRPEIATYIRDVHIKALPPKPQPTFSRHKDLKTHDLRIFLSKLAHLRLLSADNVRIVPGSPTSELQAFTAQPRVEISIVDLHMASFYRVAGRPREVGFQEALLDFLGCFSVIGTLRIDSAWLGTPWPKTVKGPMHPILPGESTQVRALELCKPIDAFARYLVPCLPMENLRSLEVDSGTFHSLTFDDQFQMCITSASSLRELKIHISSPNPVSFEMLSVSLSTCATLETLSLKFSIANVDRFIVEDTWQCAMALLSSLSPSCPLTRLGLFLEVPPNAPETSHTIYRSNWDVFTETIECLPYLATVEIVINSPGFSDDCAPRNELISLFTRSPDDLFPKSRRYSAVVKI